MKTAATTAHCASLLPSTSQLIPVLRVSRRNVHIQSFERGAADISNLVRVALLNEKHGALAQRNSVPVDCCASATGDDKQPLIGATMAIVCSTFTVAGLDHHLGRLRT